MTDASEGGISVSDRHRILYDHAAFPEGTHNTREETTDRVLNPRMGLSSIMSSQGVDFVRRNCGTQQRRGRQHGYSHREHRTRKTQSSSLEITMIEEKSQRALPRAAVACKIMPRQRAPRRRGSMNDLYCKLESVSIVTTDEFSDSKDSKDTIPNANLCQNVSISEDESPSPRKVAWSNGARLEWLPQDS